MSIAPGTRLGPYEITAKLGEGGMGEVYRATDTKLEREVAIKVLPAAFTDDEARLRRFEREAKLLAQLHHPHIASIFGLEESEGISALVMELVEGPTLAERLAAGPISVEEALPIARQIALALEAAHDKGIIHRDLKPQNVKLTVDGEVKVLDFGLAKAMESGGGTEGSPLASPSMMSSPTLTALPGTQLGVILGTAAYMAPEQARGQTVDKRADIWAFGVVLWEMLTGAKLFAADTVSDTLAGVLKTEIDLDRLPAGTPAAIRRLLRRCLERNPKNRLHDIADARLVIDDVLAGRAESRVPEAAKTPRAHPLVLIAGGLALLAAGWFLRPAPRSEEPPVRYVDLATAGFDNRLSQRPSISPDGARIVYSAGGSLWVRSLDEVEPHELLDTADAPYPSWSPDGRALAYAHEGRVWRISAEGGEATDLGPGPTGLAGSGGSTWSADRRIVFTGSDTVGLWALPAAGGPGREILAIDRDAESDFHEIASLPAARGLIFTVHRRDASTDTIDLLADGTRRTLIEVSGESLRHPIYSPTGHIVYERETTNPGIWAVPFSLDHLETTGSPFLVVPGGSSPSVAGDGTFCYVRREDPGIELVRVSRSGVAESVADLAGTETAALKRVPVSIGMVEGGVSLSPDGSRLALSLGYSPSLLAVFDLSRGLLTRVAVDIFPNRAVWASRGERLVYGSAHGARAWNLAWRRADAVGDEERLSTSDEMQVPLALSPDGARLIYKEGSFTGPLLTMSLVPGSEASPLFGGEVGGLTASFSPDGNWLAYDSFESDRSEVYVRPFPEGNQRFQLSTGGGGSPVWSQSGEIFYTASGGLWSVSVTPRGESLSFSKPVQLFRTGGESRLETPFDATPDGQGFYMLRTSGSEHLSLILSWPRELARRSALAGARQAD